MEILGIDISMNNGKIDWEKVGATHKIGFAMIKCAYREYGSGNIVEDEQFEDNINGATKFGMPIGIYFKSAAISEKEAKEEAQWMINAVDGRKITWPLALQYGHRERTDMLTRDEKQRFAMSFLQKIQKNGYMPMMYASQGSFCQAWKIKDFADNGIKLWVARYGANDGRLQERYKPNIGEDYQIWQYTSKGVVDGISSLNVDLNISYVDYGNNIHAEEISK